MLQEKKYSDNMACETPKISINKSIPTPKSQYLSIRTIDNNHCALLCACDHHKAVYAFKNCCNSHFENLFVF